MSDLKPRDLHYFDYLSIAREAGMSQADLVVIERLVRADYGSDDNLFELRMLRTCSAIRDRRVTVQQVLVEPRDSEASAA
jgi:hypothetical protein